MKICTMNNEEFVIFMLLFILLLLLFLKSTSLNNSLSNIERAVSTQTEAAIERFLKELERLLLCCYILAF